MTQILLGQSYFLRFDPKLWEAMQPYPPLGTLYAASYLRQHGYEVALFDAMLAESEEEWAHMLDVHQPQYAILYEDNFNYLSKMCLLRMRAAAFTMIEMAKTRGCVVILCGADAADHHEIYLAKGADYVLIGEGEETLIELLEALAKKQDPNPILGLATSSTQLVKRRPDIADLDKIPFPAWDLVDVEKYRAIWLKRHGYFSMNMVTTRGCPFHCNWCAKPIWGQRYHSRSPENVAAEMKWLKETYHPDRICKACQPSRLEAQDVVSKPDVIGMVRALQQAHFSSYILWAAAVVALPPDRFCAPIAVERAPARGHHIH